jgi:TRAP transporter TAXI family solute receptor
MTKQRRNLVILGLTILAGLTLIVAACTPSAPSPSGKSEQPARLTFAGGSIGGTSNIAAAAFAGVASKFLGIETTVIIQTPAKAPTFVDEGTADISVCPPPPDWDAYTGTGSYKGEKPMKDLRVLTLFEATSIDVLVPQNSPIKTFKDLKGKRISTGKKGMLADAYFVSFCDALGIAAKDVDPQYLGHEEASANMALGKIDAVFVLGPHPHTTYAQTDLTLPLRFLQMSNEELAAINKAMPYLYTATVKPLYHTQGDYKGVFVIQQMIASTRLPEVTAYGIVKNFMNNPDLMGSYRESLKTTITSGEIKTATESLSWGTPYHAGSVRYFKEVGWKVPKERMPPEAK